MLYPLPEFVQTQLAALTDSNQQHLKQASAELSRRYRQAEAGQHLQHHAAVSAYLQLRLPATYAVMCQVWERLRTQAPDLTPRSLADLGAGPGTASLAAVQRFASLNQLHLLETDARMRQAGQSIFAGGPAPLPAASWQAGRLPVADWPTTDLACLSYVLNELPQQDWPQLFDKLASRHRLLVFVEPGTPQGFEHLRQVRNVFLQTGWQVWAPCPHQQACPITAPDWCHFAQRLARSPLHRQLKGAVKGHEDEKFAYLILGQTPVPQAAEARILRHPLHHKGHLRLQLCTPDGLQSAVRSKKDANWKQARQLAWGDSL
ncbi:MAG: hypothetical protein IGS03_18445 [Candidatus Sericytochromatia bacterium]|nr:hypothetical protein [Candidatus Sericytochromatia bacterium]